jgi:hypothetical protein
MRSSILVNFGGIMSILVNGKTKVVIQGITGNEGMFHTRQMVEYGTKVVAGVTPGKGGQKIDGIPIRYRKRLKIPMPMLLLFLFLQLSRGMPSWKPLMQASQSLSV